MEPNQVSPNPNVQQPNDSQPIINKSGNYRWLIKANLATVPTSITIAVVLSLVFKEAGAYIAIIFIPLFLAMWVVLAIDVVVGIKILYKKLAGKA